MEQGAVDFVHLSDKIDSEARQDVERIMEQMKDGDFKVFEGPIHDNTGELRVPEGEVYKGDDLWFMDWYVEGVKGEFPGE
jgi:simple sugar transport system substrate-binding protein